MVNKTKVPEVYTHVYELSELHESTRIIDVSSRDKNLMPYEYKR